MKDGTTTPPAGIDPEAALRQAAALQNRGDLAGAEKIFRLILKQHPDSFNTLYALAGVLWRTERFEEATRFLRKALNQKPNSAEAHALLAAVLRSMGRYEEALERARRAIALRPEFADAHAHLAQSLADLGRHEEAAQAQRQAVALAPGQPLHYFRLGDFASWTADDPRLAALEAMRQNPQRLPPDEQVFLHYALAKAYSDCGDIERSFRLQIEGGALKRRMLRYDEAATLGPVEDLCRVCDMQWMLRHQGAGDPSPLPIFVVGMPRTGSTLVEQILISHPGVDTIGESSALVAALAEAAGGGSSVVQRVGAFSDSDLRTLGARYLQSARRAIPAEAARIVDKTPWNFRFAGLIHAALPNARIIHVTRSSLDTCLSIFATLFWSTSQPYSYDLGELGRYYRAYEKTMAHWRAVLPPEAMLDVCYEDIVEDVESQARRIIAWCRLEWDDACLAFHKAERPVRTASHAQVRKPIYRNSLRRPRPPEEMLRPLLEGLGATK